VAPRKKKEELADPELIKQVAHREATGSETEFCGLQMACSVTDDESNLQLSSVCGCELLQHFSAWR
jgi:hypothetical protein